MNTLSDLEKVERDYLVPTEIAGVLHCMPYSINVAAREDPGSLGFPVIRVGKYVRIPKQAFLRFMRGEMCPHLCNGADASSSGQAVGGSI